MSSGPNAGTYFVHSDHLGSLNVLSNSSGLEAQRLRYIPFGETHSNTGSVDFDPYRYTGQELDPETGLYYYGARYYNPALARFLSPDPIVADPTDPQSFNRYSYARNNPLNRVDPSGQFDEDEETGPSKGDGGMMDEDAPGLDDPAGLGVGPSTSDCTCPDDVQPTGPDKMENVTYDSTPALGTPSKADMKECTCAKDIDTQGQVASQKEESPFPGSNFPGTGVEEREPEKGPAPEFGGRGESGGVGAGAATPGPSAKSSPARSPRSPALKSSFQQNIEDLAAFAQIYHAIESPLVFAFVAAVLVTMVVAPLGIVIVGVPSGVGLAIGLTVAGLHALLTGYMVAKIAPGYFTAFKSVLKHSISTFKSIRFERR